MPSLSEKWTLVPCLRWNPMLQPQQGFWLSRILAFFQCLAQLISTSTSCPHSAVSCAQHDTFVSTLNSFCIFLFCRYMKQLFLCPMSSIILSSSSLDLLAVVLFEISPSLGCMSIVVCFQIIFLRYIVRSLELISVGLVVLTTCSLELIPMGLFILTTGSSLWALLYSLKATFLSSWWDE